MEDIIIETTDLTSIVGRASEKNYVWNCFAGITHKYAHYLEYSFVIVAIISFSLSLKLFFDHIWNIL